MKQLKKFPPNYLEIKKRLSPDKNAIFTHGEIIYNPSSLEIPEDVIIHEEVHCKQQKRYSTIDFWWLHYLTDHDFRLDQELESYATQLNWIKERYNNKGYKEALTEFAANLSSPMYKLELSQHEAETRIRRVARDI